MLNAVMTTSGFTGDQQKEAISNTVWFLSEYNDHFIPDVEENEILITNRDSPQLFNDHVIIGNQKSMGVFYNSFA